MMFKKTQGSHNPQAKFTDDEIRAIRKEYKAGKSQKEIARERGVSVSCIYAIVTFRSYVRVFLKAD